MWSPGITLVDSHNCKAAALDEVSTLPYLRRMRLILATLSALVLVSTGFASARPLDVHVRVHRAPDGRITGYLVRHGLLTAEQAACTTFVPGPHGSRRVEHVSVYERSGDGCPGVASPPTFLFDVFVDTISGVVDKTPLTRDRLDTVL